MCYDICTLYGAKNCGPVIKSVERDKEDACEGADEPSERRSNRMFICYLS